MTWELITVGLQVRKMEEEIERSSIEGKAKEALVKDLARIWTQFLDLGWEFAHRRRR